MGAYLCDKMQYISTRDEAGTAHSFKQVVMKGLANDGGLFVPREVPQLDSATIAVGRPSLP